MIQGELVHSYYIFFTENRLTSLWIAITLLSLIAFSVCLLLKLRIATKKIKAIINNNFVGIDNNKYLSNAWNTYANHFQEVNNELKTDDFAQTYFNNSVLDSFLNMRFWLSLPGTFVGFGILGTFVGLTIGIDGFDSSSSEGIQTSIQTLLSGISTAFYTSLFGIGSSIIFGFLEKYFFNKFNHIINTLCIRLNNKYKLTKQEKHDIEIGKQKDLLSAWEDTFSNHQIEIKTTIVDEFKNLNKLITECTSKSSLKTEEVMYELLTTKDRDGNLLKLPNMQRDLLTESEKQTVRLTSFSTELADVMYEKLEKNTRDSLLPAFTKILVSLEKLDEGIKGFSSNAGKDIGLGVNQAISSLQNELRVIISDFSKAFSSGALQQLDKVVDTLNQSTEIIKDMPSFLTKAFKKINATNDFEAINRKNAIKLELDATIDKFSKAIDLITEQLKKQEEVRLVREKDAHNKISNGFVARQEKIEQGFDRFIDKVGNLIHSITDNLEKNGKEITNITQQQVEATQNNSKKVQEQLTTNMNFITSNFNKSIESISENLSRIENAQVEREKKLINTMNTDLSNSINNISDLLKTQEQYKVNLESILSAITSTLNSSKQLSDSNFENALLLDEVSSDFKNASNELKSSTVMLQDSSNNLMHAGTVVNEDLHKITDFNNTTFKNMNETYERSIQALKTLNRDYEMIQNEIGNIFEEIDKGIKNYSQITRVELNNTLKQFTDSLVKGTKGLSGSIEMLNDFVNDLENVLDK